MLPTNPDQPPQGPKSELFVVSSGFYLGLGQKECRNQQGPLLFTSNYAYHMTGMMIAKNYGISWNHHPSWWVISQVVIIFHIFPYHILITSTMVPYASHLMESSTKRQGLWNLFPVIWDMIAKDYDAVSYSKLNHISRRSVSYLLHIPVSYLLSISYSWVWIPLSIIFSFIYKIL